MTSPFPVPLAPSNLARPPVFWSAPEVKAWVEFCVQEFSLAPIAFDRFDMNGKALTLLTRSDFMERAPHAGDVLYNAFRHLCVASVSGNNYTFNAHIKTPVYISTSKDVISQHDFLHPGMASQGAPPSPFIPILPHPSTPKSEGREVAFNTDVVVGMETVPASILSPAATDKSLSDTESYNESSPKVCEASTESQTLVHTSVSDCKDLPQDVDKLLSDQKDCRLLWEFIYQLLLEDKNKDLVCWESLSDLVFRINDPVSLAEQWGSQKNRSNMTYEKLSRALRYYYKMNIINKVPGKKLTYQFMQSPTKIRKGQRGAKPHSLKSQDPIENGQEDLPISGNDVNSKGKTETDFCTPSSSSSPKPVSCPLSTQPSIIRHRNGKEPLDNEGEIPTTAANDSLIYSKYGPANTNPKSQQNHCSDDFPDNHITMFHHSHKNQPGNFTFERQPSCGHTCLVPKTVAKEEPCPSDFTGNVLTSNFTRGNNQMAKSEDMESCDICSPDVSSNKRRCLGMEPAIAMNEKSQTLCELPSVSLSSFSDFQKLNIAHMKTVSSMPSSTTLHSKDDLDKNDNVVAFDKNSIMSISDPPMRQPALFTNHEELKSSKYLSENVMTSHLSNATDVNTSPHMISQRSLTDSPDIQNHKISEVLSFHRNNSVSSGLSYHHVIKPAHSSSHQRLSPYTIPIPLAHKSNKSMMLMYEPSSSYNDVFRDTNNINHWSDQETHNLTNPKYCSSTLLDRTGRNHRSLLLSSTPLSEDPNRSSTPLKKHRDSPTEYSQPASNDRHCFGFKMEPNSCSSDLPEDLSIKKENSTTDTEHPADMSNMAFIPESSPVIG